MRFRFLGSFVEGSVDQPMPAESVETSIPSSSEGNSTSTSAKKKRQKRAELAYSSEREEESLAGMLKLGKTGLGSSCGAFEMKFSFFPQLSLFAFSFEETKRLNFMHFNSQEIFLMFWIHFFNSTCVMLDLDFQGKLS